MALLEVTGISKNFGSTHVLQNISLNLEKGEALAIIGSSGSGKTTLLRCLNFLETPKSSRALHAGRQDTRHSTKFLPNAYATCTTRSEINKKTSMQWNASRWSAFLGIIQVNGKNSPSC